MSVPEDDFDEGDDGEEAGNWAWPERERIGGLIVDMDAVWRVSDDHKKREVVRNAWEMLGKETGWSVATLQRFKSRTLDAAKKARMKRMRSGGPLALPGRPGRNDAKERLYHIFLEKDDGTRTVRGKIVIPYQCPEESRHTRHQFSVGIARTPTRKREQPPRSGSTPPIAEETVAKRRARFSEMTGASKPRNLDGGELGGIKVVFPRYAVKASHAVLGSSQPVDRLDQHQPVTFHSQPVGIPLVQSTPTISPDLRPIIPSPTTSKAPALPSRPSSTVSQPSPRPSSSASALEEAVTNFFERPQSPAALAAASLHAKLSKIYKVDEEQYEEALHECEEASINQSITQAAGSVVGSFILKRDESNSEVEVH